MVCGIIVCFYQSIFSDVTWWHHYRRTALPSVIKPLHDVKIKSPIEQYMLGRGGLFRQENIEKRKFMSVREWAELCSKVDYMAPGVDDVGLHARNALVQPRAKRTKKKTTEVTETASAGPDADDLVIKEEPADDEHPPTLTEPSVDQPVSPPNSAPSPSTPKKELSPAVASSASKQRPKRATITREAREAGLAEKAARDAKFLEAFDPHTDWLPPNTKATDYTPDFCQKLERQFWRNCGLGRPAWYGADSQGSLYSDETKAWNVAHLHSTLSRLLPASDQGLPGVNTPYLYFGMWRATFAWHVEDMDLFSINYIHFGAPKFWYAIPQGRANALEQTMRGYFPKDTSQCPQFLRHKSFLASPTLLAQSSCRPNHLVQHAGEFVVTFPRGYHAGFNLGFNCAESVNFALDSWLEIGKRAKACECISDSVRIDVGQLLMDRAAEAANPPEPSPAKPKPKRPSKAKASNDNKPRAPRKRESEGKPDVTAEPKLKKIKVKPLTTPKTELPVLQLSAMKFAGSASGSSSSAPKVHVTLKLGPKPVDPEPYPCCLCISMSKEGLLRVQDPPAGRKDAIDAASNPKVWMAHEFCANVVPETWVDDFDGGHGPPEKVVFGVDGIVKDRWNLKCSACTKARAKAHGAPIQCTKGKCPKAFHVSCARDGASNDIIFDVVREVEKEVVLLDPVPASTVQPTSNTAQSSQQQTDVVGTSFGGAPMDVDGGHAAPNPSEEIPQDAQVLKIIKKVEVTVLCAQHNPAVAAKKKANKHDKIREVLSSLSPMARIKIRVSAGVFEVSLLRVIEETSSVEVLWDRGLKREFKWGSVVFGSTDGPIQQKPSELVPESQRAPVTLPVVTYPSVSAATSANSYTAPSAQPPNPSPPIASTSTATPSHSSAEVLTPQTYPNLKFNATPYDYWPYQGAQTPFIGPSAAAAGTYPTAFAFYGQPAGAGVGVPLPQYNAYMYAQNGSYRGGQLHWQQPYQGPQTTAGANQSPPDGQAQPSLIAESFPTHTAGPTAGEAQSLQSPQGSQPMEEQSASAIATPTSSTPVPVPAAASSSSTTEAQPTTSGSSSTEAIHTALQELTSLPPDKIVEVLRNNPALRDVVLAAYDSQKTVDNASGSSS
ncbi:hypothetical protein HGRIS_010714 [Hohenbuehelia grisea]|uniref:[Histone H3]-trimethyl-L-lysine(9) demethylase n=1 Tax=Hohenbuehelia grisea TaxID=104357 RepID=A0ABR3IXS4_9AGAR